MDLRQLDSFVHVVDAGSFSRAAAARNVAQPTLSRQVSRLESELGARLLARTGRGVRTTDAGEALLTHARSMLELAARASDAVRDLDHSPGGRVSVGLPPRVAQVMAVPLVRAFRARFPRAVISIAEGLSLQLFEGLIGGRLDLALLFDPPASPQLAVQTLAREALQLVGPRTGPRLPPRVSLAGLARWPLVLPSAPNAIRHVVDAALRPRGIRLQVVAEVGAVETALALVASGEACTIVPRSALLADGNARRFQVATIGSPPLRNTLVLALPRAGPANRLTRETAAMVRALEFRQLVRSRA